MLEPGIRLASCNDTPRVSLKQPEPVCLSKYGYSRCGGGGFWKAQGVGFGPNAII